MICVSTDTPQMLRLDAGAVLCGAKSRGGIDTSSGTLTDSPELSRYAVLALRDSYITDIGVCFHLCYNDNAEGQCDIIAQIWCACNTDSNFKPLADAVIRIPVPTGSQQPNKCFADTIALENPIYVQAGSRLIYSISIESPDVSTDKTIGTCANGGYILKQ